MDPITLDGQLETSTLKAISVRYHYLVYFFLAVTLVAYIFYLWVNPNASVINAMYVTGSLVLVYIMARFQIL